MTPDENDDYADDVIATVTYCTYIQCSDRTVPCPSCTTIEVAGEKTKSANSAEQEYARKLLGGREE